MLSYNLQTIKHKRLVSKNNVSRSRVSKFRETTVRGNFISAHECCDSGGGAQAFFGNGTKLTVLGKAYNCSYISTKSYNTY